jgi:hypothetical protein
MKGVNAMRDEKRADEGHSSKGYEQRADEADKWYARFRRFCDLGPSRSLLKCYQVVMGEEEEGASEDGSAVERRSVPEWWRKKADAFDWKGRAAAWDREQREQAVQNVEETLIQVSMDAQEVRTFYINLMRGLIQMPKGEMAVVKDIYQRRQAAKALQNWSSTARVLLQESQDLKRGRIKVTEMMMNAAWEEEAPEEQEEDA